jgi:hypothetical protein
MRLRATGLGITTASSVAHASYLSSRKLCAALKTALRTLPRLPPAGVATPLIDHHVADAFADLQFVPSADAEPLHHHDFGDAEWTNEKLMAEVHVARLAAVIRGDADPHAAQWHRGLVSAPGARAWLCARPSLHPGFYMSPAEGRAALALCARIPLSRAQRECSACKEAMDVHGYHALGCRSSGIPNRKHYAQRDLLVDLHKAA